MIIYNNNNNVTNNRRKKNQPAEICEKAERGLHETGNSREQFPARVETREERSIG